MEYELPKQIKQVKSLVLIGGGLESEMLVVGWIGQLFETVEFKHLRLPPLYILLWIALWFSQEDLHCFDDWGYEHFVIAVKDLIHPIF